MSKTLNDARAADRAGRFPEAEKLYRAAIRQAPKDKVVLLAFVQFCLRVPGALPAVFVPLATLFTLDPKSDQLHRLAAQAHHTMGEADLGLKHARRAVELAPQGAENHYVLAYILDRAGMAPAALAAADTTLALSPDHRHGLRLRAQILISLGRMEEAAAICHRVHSLDPDNLQVYSLYSRTGKLAPDDPLVCDLTDRILPIAIRSGPKQAATVWQMLAKLRQDQGDYRAAFLAYVSAKAADPVRPDYPAYRKFVTSQLTGISRADFFGWTGSGDDRPVFIIGMPRSGSTLLEQILSGHSHVGAIGESPLMGQIAEQAGIRDRDGPRMVDVVKGLTQGRALALSGVYSRALDSLAPDKTRVVDKFLHNFERLALIARLFPRARILHALRDPMDNCLSCYMSNLSKWHSYTQDLTSLGQFYRDHIRLMDHWKKVLPNPILEVRYEDVVADTEGQARRIIEFLGLDWEPGCLKFQESDNKARTLSAWQVRQPIYTSSVKRWKRYEEFLDPLKAEVRGFYPEGF